MRDRRHIFLLNLASPGGPAQIWGALNQHTVRCLRPRRQQQSAEASSFLACGCGCQLREARAHRETPRAGATRHNRVWRDPDSGTLVWSRPAASYANKRPRTACVPRPRASRRRTNLGGVAYASSTSMARSSPPPWTDFEAGAIDAFLDWRRLERDATPRSVES